MRSATPPGINGVYVVPGPASQVSLNRTSAIKAGPRDYSLSLGLLPGDPHGRASRVTRTRFPSRLQVANFTLSSWLGISLRFLKMNPPRYEVSQSRGIGSIIDSNVIVSGEILMGTSVITGLHAGQGPGPPHIRTPPGEEKPRHNSDRRSSQFV